MNQIINENILIKFILGETTIEENSTIEKWIGESLENEKKYKDIKSVWEASKQFALESKVNENEAWERFKQNKLKQKIAIPKERSVLKQLVQQSFWLKAAVLLVFISIGLWISFSVFINPINNHSVVTVRSLNEIRIDTLPDGSIITLNKNAELSYPKKFTKSRRTVHLKDGEAFFNVQTDASKPFIVKVNQAEVKVLGTSFNIKAKKDHTELIVETGLVEVSQKDLTIRLKRNEKIEIDTKTNHFEKESNTDNLYKYYRNNELIADNTPLWRLIEVLNEAYNTQITIDGNELKNTLINTTFKDQSIDKILSILCETLTIKEDRNGNQIILHK